MQTSIFLQAALNSDRIHRAAPHTPTPIAEAARVAVDGGAQSVHVHAFDAGREALGGAACAKVPGGIRALCHETPISLTTAAAIVGDRRKRFSIVEAWEESLTLLLRTRSNRKGCIHDNRPFVRAIPFQVAAKEDATVTCAAAVEKETLDGHSCQVDDFTISPPTFANPL
jgi:uncharacterized protein (DUF849 family)